jgi:hypothetical protein
LTSAVRYAPSGGDTKMTPMMMVTARSWWRMLVGDKFGGVLQIIEGCGFLGVGRNPWRFGRH